MTAAEAKKHAQRGLQHIRDWHGKPYGDAHIVGAAWSIFAHIAGDESPAPWEQKGDEASTEHTPAVRA